MKRIETADQGDLEDLVRQATIVVDTNVLLELYRLSVPARDEAIAALESIGTRLWVPNQVVEEFGRHVDVARAELAAAYAKARGLMVKASNDAKQAFGASRRWKESRGNVSSLLDETVDQFCTALDALADVDDAIVPVDADPVLGRIGVLLDVAAGEAPDPSTVRRRVEEFTTWRAPNRIPPGWRDVPAKHTPLLQSGDYLLWAELLDHAERTSTPFLLVTNDQKDDWFTKDGRPLPELVKEFRRRSSYRYEQMNFENFLILARKALGVSVDETSLEEVVEERQANAAESTLSDVLRGREPDNFRGESGSEMPGDMKSYPVLRAALGQLSDKDRSLLVLHYLQRMEVAEIGAVLGVTEKRAARMLEEAVQRLRAKVDETEARLP